MVLVWDEERGIENMIQEGESMKIINYFNINSTSELFKVNSLIMSLNAEVISSFNALNFKKILNIKDMEGNKSYSIDGAYRTTTKYGNSVVLQLGERNLYLPKRFNTLDDEVIASLSNGLFYISKIPLKDDEDNSLYKLEIQERLPSNAFYPPYSDY